MKSPQKSDSGVWQQESHAILRKNCPATGNCPEKCSRRSGCALDGKWIDWPEAGSRLGL